MSLTWFHMRFTLRCVLFWTPMRSTNHEWRERVPKVQTSLTRWRSEFMIEHSKLDFWSNGDSWESLRRLISYLTKTSELSSKLVDQCGVDQEDRKQHFWKMYRHIWTKMDFPKKNMVVVCWCGHWFVTSRLAIWGTKSWGNKSSAHTSTLLNQENIYCPIQKTLY